MPHWEGMCLKVRERPHAARGDEKAAREEFATAIAIFDDLASRLDLRRALAVRGGDDNLTRARDLFQACGAPTDLAEIPQQLS